jgi:hypothetical protein
MISVYARSKDDNDEMELRIDTGEDEAMGGKVN